MSGTLLVRSFQRFLPAVLGCALACSSGSDEGDQHDTVRVKIIGNDAAAFSGTRGIEMTFEYGSCLLSFYKTNANYRQDGIDGGLVFATWQEALCPADPQGDDLACSVSSMDQNIEGDNNYLRIQYEVKGGAVAGKELNVGPFPLEALSMCTGTENVVRFKAAIGRDDLDGRGQTLWSTQNADGSGQATPGQGADLVVRLISTST